MENSPLIRIVTHDGPFHSDEVLSVAILTKIFKNHQVIRTRDKTVIDLADIVVDVGSVYNHQLRRYDHHMTNPPMDARGHLFSSAGLVWYHYHSHYLRSIGIPKTIDIEGVFVELEYLVEKIIRNRWIIPIDRGDNGFHSGPTPISELVSAMSPIDPEKSRDKFNKQFLEAVSMVSHLFERACFHIVDSVITKVKVNTCDKELYFDDRVVCVNVEVKDFSYFSNIDSHFVVYPVIDHNDGETYFNIRPIYNSVTKEYKTPFPTSICGISPEEIEEKGFQDITFIHHSGFMDKARSKEAAIEFCGKMLPR
jgi:uncharacterized UPF0160 family protein